MSDQNEKNKEGSGQQPTDYTPYTYRWNYADQCAYEERQKKQEKKHGAAVYSIVMISAFALCFAILCAVLIFYYRGTLKPINDWNSAAMSTGEVADAVTPATVLIRAENAESGGYGTGFFLTENGYIATNYHVIRSYTEIWVTLYSGTEVSATLIGYSEADDLAVLKIAGTGYPTVKIGNSDYIKIGDTAIAIGNPSGEDASWTTTKGIISATQRKVTVTGFNGNSTVELTMLQTDAPVNPGNSGGPLCNDRGEVIGVVTRKMTNYESIGLALPINGAMEILNEIIKSGNANAITSTISRERPSLGITGMTVEKGKSYDIIVDGKPQKKKADAAGVMVMSVLETGAAYQKLSDYDIITAADGKAVDSIEALTELLYDYKSGDQIELTVMRSGTEQRIKIRFR